MYFPYLRGRQFELIALRELIDLSLIGEKVIPIIEPVKLSSTLTKTLLGFINAGRNIAFVYNPQVGNFVVDAKKEANDKQLEILKKSIIEKNVIQTHYFCKTSNDTLNRWKGKGIKASDIMIIIDDEDFIPIYSEYFDDEPPKYSLIRDESEFRSEIHDNRVMMANRFKKQLRNTDYAKKDDEPFSNDHLYYKRNGYVGFSDFSIIGADYSDSGFAPYAVAIHIVYFDDKKKLRVRHFVSDTNDDISDPAGKFAEAVKKLVIWNKTEKINTYAMKRFEELYAEEKYPGLGTVKKLSLMHHLELMSSFLDEEIL